MDGPKLFREYDDHFERNAILIYNGAVTAIEADLSNDEGVAIWDTVMKEGLNIVGAD